jgi:hypothetical protein
VVPVSGRRSLVAAATFYVAGTQGPLVDGELERARVWGVSLTTDVPAFP